MFYYILLLKNVYKLGSFYLVKDQSRDGSTVADDWDERPRTIEDIQALLQTRKEAALKREKSLSHAFSNQVFFILYFQSK